MSAMLSLTATEASRQPDAEMEFCQQLLLLNRDGSFYWPDERILVVSDLHLEKASSFATRNKTFLPPYDTKQTLQRLRQSIQIHEPKTVISLGDSFHDDNGSERLPIAYRQELCNLMANVEWIWVRGNHDPSPPRNLGGTALQEVPIRGLNFRHEPGQSIRDGEIAGHLHPCAKIRQRGKSVRRACFAEDGRRLILPAFGSFTGGLNLRDAAFGGILNPMTTTAWMLGTDAVYRICSSQLVH